MFVLFETDDIQAAQREAWKRWAAIDPIVAPSVEVLTRQVDEWNARSREGIRACYSDDVVMEEPAYGKTVGLEANLEREEKFVASVKQLKGFEATKVGIGDGVSLYENVMDWIDVNDNEVHVEQVSVMEWRDGKIVHERFYYNM